MRRLAAIRFPYLAKSMAVIMVSIVGRLSLWMGAATVGDVGGE